LASIVEFGYTISNMSGLNAFSNPNVESWFKFIFRSDDSLTAVSLYFLSRRYSTSPRFFPLYNETRRIRIVLFKGSRFPGVDRVILKLLPFYIRVFSRKFTKYKWTFLFSTSWSRYLNSGQILNVDDPEFTEQELKALLTWEQECQQRGIQTIVATTTHYIKDYFLRHGSQSLYSVIPQGHSQQSIDLSGSKDATLNPKISLVYASPYIHSKGDLHGEHLLWGSSLLLEEIWAPIAASNRFVLHLIGEVGPNAMKSLEKVNTVIHGLVSIEECANILKNCDIGLYPRVKDNFRQVQKISEYIGAGLAIVTFDLMDTSLVKELNIGISVKTVHEFKSALIELERDRTKLSLYKKRSREASQELSWRTLGKRLDQLVS